MGGSSLKRIQKMLLHEDSGQDSPFLAPFLGPGGSPGDLGGPWGEPGRAGVRGGCRAFSRSLSRPRRSDEPDPSLQPCPDGEVWTGWCGAAPTKWRLFSTLRQERGRMEMQRARQARGAPPRLGRSGLPDSLAHASRRLSTPVPRGSSAAGGPGVVLLRHKGRPPEAPQTWRNAEEARGAAAWGGR